jgi:hypothetical protein
LGVKDAVFAVLLNGDALEVLIENGLLALPKRGEED